MCSEKNVTLRFIFYSLFFTLHSLLFTSLSFASFSIYPEVNEIVAPAGAKVKGNFWVFNRTDGTLKMKVEPENWTEGRKKGIDWLKIKPLRFEIEPQKYREVKYKAKVPKNARGDIVVQVFFSQEVPEKKGITIGIRVGTIVYITVEGTLEINPEISDFEVIDSDENLGFKILFENKSNVHLKVSGNILIKDEKGREIKKIEIKPWTFLAGQKQPVYCWLKKSDLKKGDYIAFAKILYKGPLKKEGEVNSKLDFFIK